MNIGLIVHINLAFGSKLYIQVNLEQNRMKKAQGLPITTIIIAALALVVLVVLFAIFTGRIGIFAREVQSCSNPCVESTACETAGGFSLPGEYINPENRAEKCGKPSDQKMPAHAKVCCSAK